MNEKISTSYEADLDQEYEGLTEKHKTIKAQLEKAISQYLKDKKGKPATIQGPYGSGKTQILYYLFKYCWDNGGVGIYTHLEKIIPAKEMGPLDYAEYLKKLVKEESQLLANGDSKLMMGKVKDYAINSIKKISSNENPIILFVDEVEQQYKLLDSRVNTDDRSPMREVIARVNNGEAGFYLLMAFAPVSFYEFSKGEAQTGRFLPIILPIVEPMTIRTLFGETGNLIWWMGKGRYRGVSRTQDILSANVSDIRKISKKELLDICNNIGPIGGVPALEFENIEKVDDFDIFRDFLVHLEPNEQGGEIHSGPIKVVTKCRIFNNEKCNLNDILEKSLRNSEVSKVTDISHYLSIILDALSTSDGKKPLFIEPTDWKELLNIVEDVILEFEGENKLPSEDLRKLQENISDFLYKIRSNVDSISVVKEGYCITPLFLRTLFPFPISSPNLTNKNIDEQRENLGDQTYLAKEERNGISIAFFLNADKIKEYLVQESKNFLNEAKALVTVNLGKETNINIPKLAQWLQKEGRLRVISLTQILSDFLVSFLYWVKNEHGESLPINLLDKLEEYHSKAEKDKARKIAYYDSRIREYLDRELPKLPISKYALGDKTGFDEFKVGRVGLVSEVIGFAFVDGKNDWESIYKFRQEFKNTEFIRSESTNKKTGVPTALENLVVEDRKTKGITIGVVLRRISDSFRKHLPDLTEVVDEINKEEFVRIPTDKDSERIFEGIFLYLKEWKDPSKAKEKFREAKSIWDGLANRVDEISIEIEAFKKLTDENILLTHSLDADKIIIGSIGKLLGEYQEKISPYTKFLLSTFTMRTVEVVEPKLNAMEKQFGEFQNSIKDKIEEYKSTLKSIEAFEKDTFKWINERKDDVQKEFQQKFEDACKEFTKSGKIDLENVPNADSFINSVDEITNEVRTLEEINESMKQCITKAQEINDKLKEWGSK